MKFGEDDVNLIVSVLVLPPEGANAGHFVLITLYLKED